MIKLMQLYKFRNLTDSVGTDYSGIWETIEVRGLATKKSPIWVLVRVASFKAESPVGEKIELVQLIIEHYANRIDRAALQGVPVITEGSK